MKMHTLKKLIKIIIYSFKTEYGYLFLDVEIIHTAN